MREAARRALGQRLFDEQVLAGLALAEGALAEMATGEGKTLAAVAPVFVHAVAGRGAHVLTFNDYLARRDAAWMGPVYERLGLTVGFVQERQGAAERRAAYAADVTYLTAKEAGFDHLRDGLCLEPGERVQRAYHFALVDEADSILIDEARVPLVIAGESDAAVPEPSRLAALVRTLRAGVDFDTDEHAHNIALTEAGTARVEAALDCRGGLHETTHVALHAQLRHALHAEHLLRRDVDYIVRGGRVELVDESTGRVAERRHWPDGLQAAVEAKEGLRLSAEGRILGSVTLQHFLRLYPAPRRYDRDRAARGRRALRVLRPAHRRRPHAPADGAGGRAGPRVHAPRREGRSARARDHGGARDRAAGARRHRERRRVGGTRRAARRRGRAVRRCSTRRTTRRRRRSSPRPAPPGP